MKRIYMKCLSVSCFVTFDLEEFEKEYKTEKHDDDTMLGLSCGNGIWIKINGENPIVTATHEISHYLDWLFTDIFPITDLSEVTEIRARLHEFLFKKITDMIGEKLKK